MTARKPFLRTAVAIALVLGLLTVPAVPAAADEVRGGWTQGITEWVSTWITSWQSPAESNADGNFQKRASGARQVFGPAPESGEADDFTGVDLPKVVPSIQGEQTCEGYPELDPSGKC